MKQYKERNTIAGKRSRCLFACILCFFLWGCEQETEATFTVMTSPEQAQPQTEEAEKNLLTVYICGEVQNPGVYTLEEGARVADALKLAGGFGDNADREYVNLAQRLADGEMIVFLSSEQAQEAKKEENAKKSGLVSLNRATAAEFATLPGIGESRAEDIVAYRKANGDFETLEDLMKVPGIKENTFAKLKDKLYLE